MRLQFIVQIHHMKNIHQLSLILVKSLHLHVKYGIRIHIHAVVLFDIFCQTNLVLVFDFHKFLLGGFVVGKIPEPADPGQVRDPAIANLLRHPVCQKRISVQKETSLRNAVCLVVETLREHLVEIFQFLLFQNLRVKPCHTVYGVARHNGHMGHLHLSIVKNCHLAYFFLYVHIVYMGILLFDLLHKSAVDLLHNLVNPGEQSGEQVNGPFLQSLCHDGMVGIRAGSGGDIPGFVPAQIIIIQQDTHQFGNRHRRMGIVELESHFLRETMNIVMLPHIFLHCLLHGRGDKEILLFQAQLLACVMIVIGIEHVYQVPCQVFLLHGLAVIAFVK